MRRCLSVSGSVKTAIRPATLDDVPLLVAWHADPEISRYWDDETFTVEQMRARLERDAVDAYILEEDGEPVGYLQAWWEPDEPKRGGLDGFLVPAARGRGIMPTLARRLAEQLLEAGWRHVTVDPYVSNERAIHGWANAGFVEISRDERVVLMRYGG
jgi:aminoglycoside 6'-N-acetyltransferase